jgi:hypothetical protein
MMRHFSLEYPYCPLHLDQSIVELLDDNSINLFAKSAISTNYCKDEYDFPINNFVDYTEWYSTMQSIGEQSPLNKTLERMKLTPFVYKDFMFIDKRKILMSFFLYSDISLINYEQFQQIKKVQWRNINTV